MKPIKLIISGIGPYGELMPEINFEEFEFNKPILISGETGAGKTMIFDAICFALFDTASGSYRGTDSLRSEYARPEVKSFVDFYFSHQGKNCHIHRSPSYMRPSKRGKGSTPEKEKATLYIENETPIEGIKAVNQAVKELLHVDEKQFKQLAMIAQGEFWGLLNAKTEERTGILRHIFMTDGYKNMERQLWDRRKKANASMEKLENSVIQYFCDVEPAVLESKSAEELTELQSRLKKSGGVHSLEEMLSVIDRIQADAVPEREKLEKGLQEIQQAGELLQKDITMAESQEQTLARQKQLQEQVTDLKGKLPDLLKKQQKLEEAEKNLQAKIATLLQEKENLKGIAEELQNCQHELDNLDELQKRLNKLHRSAIPEYSKEKKGLESLKEKLEAAEKKCEAAKQSREAGEIQLEKNRAGILAASLQDGIPCPVCGAVHHPAPAELPSHAVSEADVKLLKQQETKVSDDKAKAEAATAASQSRLKTLDEQIASYMLECLQSSKWQSAVARGEAMGMEIPAEATLRQLYELIRLQEQQLTMMTEEKLKMKKQLEEKKQVFTRVEKELNRAQGTETEQLRQNKQRIALEEQGVRQELAEKEGQLEALTQLNNSGRNHQEIRAYRAMLQEKLNEQKILFKKQQSKLSDIDYKLTNNQTRRDKIEAQQNEYARVKHEAYLMQRLYNLVSGQTGNGKLTLEQYIQAEGFDSIIRAANRRLIPMSDGQYELYRQTKGVGNKSHTYLDLEVLDNYTGHRRPVKNLSGGESFKASLSLALGLSDKVSSELGGIAMDALFIDEGFGTLDKRSIEKAMEILLKLSDSNKLVALISHREELIEAIGQQIQVVKTRQGSNITIELMK